MLTSLLGPLLLLFCFFFFNDTATTEIYTLSLHDALPILARLLSNRCDRPAPASTSSSPISICPKWTVGPSPRPDRKSTRLNSSHTVISYAVFCLKKKKKVQTLIKLAATTDTSAKAILIIG